MIRAGALIFVGIFAVSGQALAECQTNLKQTDGYRELSQSLACLSKRIERLESAPQPESIKLSASEPTEVTKCVIGSSLPSTAHFVLRQGFRLCRDDGSPWLRVVRIRTGDVGWRYVELAVAGEAQPIKCREENSECRVSDAQSKQSFALQIMQTKDKKEKDVFVAWLRRSTAE